MLIADERELSQVAERLCRSWGAGDVILLSGPLGAGKTTFARAVLRALGWEGPVRSPTFSLLQIYETEPPVLHADLYRLPTADGIGLEDYFSSHLCLIEWPDRLGRMLDPDTCWRVDIQFEEGLGPDCRSVTVTPPSVLR